MSRCGVAGVSVLVVVFLLAAVSVNLTDSRRTAKADKADVCPRLLMRYRKRCGGDELKRNITALWEHVKGLSRPVNVYVNGEQFAEIGPHSPPHNDHSDDIIPSAGHHGDSCEGYMFAKCDMKANTASKSEHDIKGTIYFRQKPFHVLEAKVKLSGFNTSRHAGGKQLHAIHLHEFGDLSKGCSSFGGHFNPFGTTHGGPESHGHVGDWGNLSVDRAGHVNTSLDVGQSTLFGKNSITGRGLVIHAGKDDLGAGHSHSSKVSGNAGGRIACCPVTYHTGNCEMWGK